MFFFHQLCYCLVLNAFQVRLASSVENMYIDHDLVDEQYIQVKLTKLAHELKKK